MTDYEDDVVEDEMFEEPSEILDKLSNQRKNQVRRGIEEAAERRRLREMFGDIDDKSTW